MDVEALGDEIIRTAEYIRTHQREYRAMLDEYERLRSELGGAAPPRPHFHEPDEDFL